MVPLDALRVHDVNVRHDLGDLRDLAESIRLFGALTPIVVEQRRHGHCRAAASVLVGKTRIPAFINVIPLDVADFLVAAVHENTRRRGLTSADRRSTAKAMEEAGMLRVDIAHAL